jgi:general secretion pathway protein N
VTRLTTHSDPGTAAPSWRWAAAGALAGLLAALVLFAPARWLASALRQATGERVQLTEPRGTLWTGSARLLLTGGPGSRDRAALPGRIDWQLRPAGFALQARLAADCCTREPLQLRLVPRWGGAALQVGDGQSEWPAILLAGLGTPWNTVQAQGRLALATHGLGLNWSAGRLSVAGRGELKALDVASRLSTLRPMGSYRVTLTGGDSPALELATLAGSLQLSGNGRWIGSRLRFEGEARATPDHEAALANLLNIIGRRHGARSIITVG